MTTRGKDSQLNRNPTLSGKMSPEERQKSYNSYIFSKIWVDYDVANQCLKKLNAIFDYSKKPRFLDTEDKYTRYGYVQNKKGAYKYIKSDFVSAEEIEKDISNKNNEKIDKENIKKPIVKSSDNKWNMPSYKKNYNKYGNNDLLLDHRHVGMLLIGPANSGKTSILRKFRMDIINSTKKNIEDKENHEVTSLQPVVMLNTTPAGLRVFLINVLQKLHTPICERKGQNDELVLKVTEALVKAGTRMLILDEFQNVLAGVSPGSKQNLLMQTLVHFSNEAGLSLVIAGTEDVNYAIGTVAALSSRLHAFHLDGNWRKKKAFQKMLGDLTTKIGIVGKPPLYGNETAKIIYRLTEGLIGEVADIINELIYYHGHKGYIALEDFDNIPWVKPSERHVATAGRKNIKYKK